MKLRKLLLGLLLAAPVAVGAGVFSSSNAKKPKQVSAWDDKWYVAGTFNSWNTTANKMTKISDSGNYEQWQFDYEFSANAEFKFVYNSSEWYTASLDGYSHAASAITTPSNHRINSAGKYTLTLKCEKGSSNKVLYYEQYSSVTLNKQSGTGGSSSARAVYGTSMPSITLPTREGYTFGGYFTGTSGSGTQYYNANGSSTRNWNLTDTTKTLYAKWTPTVYTITYDRNKNNGLQATQSKNYGTNVTAYTPGQSPINASGWDPSPYRRFMHWNTEYTDSGANYSAGQTISTNASFTLYYIEDWYDFRYSIDSGSSWIALAHNDAGKGEGVTAQFAPATAQNLPLHAFITFQYSANGGSTWTNLSSVTFEAGCNYNTTTGIQLATIDTIYLKYLDSGSFSCYVPGISDRTIAVFDSSSATTGGTPYTMRGNGDNETVTTLDVPIEKGQFVKRGYDGNYTYGTYFAGGTGNAASCFSQVGSDTAVECLKTGVYTVYNQKGSYGNWADVYFTRNEEASAKLLAQKFNSIIETICNGVVGGSKSLSDLQSAWGSNSSSTLYKHFSGQFTETMAYFKTNSTTSDADILACVARYDYIVKKYGTTALPDFLSRNNGYTANPEGSKLLMSFTNKDTSKIVIITIISVISVSVIGGYFFIKKCKENC